MARRDDDDAGRKYGSRSTRKSQESLVQDLRGDWWRVQKVPEALVPDNPRDLGIHAKRVPPAGGVVPPSSMGGAGSGSAGSSTETSKPRWWVGYSVDNAPSWWKGLVTDDRSPEAMYAMLINSMIPFMSPEDQRYMGDYLSRLLPEHFKDYSQAQSDTSRIPTPPQIGEQSKTYFSAERGKQMADTLEKMRVASGLPEDKVGAGYRFLKSLAKDIESFGAGQNEGITRTNLARLYSSFDQKIGETQAGELQGYGELARAIVNPFFSAGKLVGIQKDEQGNYRFQSRNPKWS